MLPDIHLPPEVTPMKHRRLLMIVNPRAGKSKSRGPLFDAAAIFSQAGYLLSIHMTTAPGDAAETAARASMPTSCPTITESATL